MGLTPSLVNQKTTKPVPLVPVTRQELFVPREERWALQCPGDLALTLPTAPQEGPSPQVNSCPGGLYKHAKCNVCLGYDRVPSKRAQQPSLQSVPREQRLDRWRDTVQVQNKRTWCSRGIQRLSRWISQQTDKWKAWKDQRTALLKPVPTLFTFPLALYHLNSNAEEMVKGKAHALRKPSRRHPLFRQGSHICPQSSPASHTKTLVF